MVARRQLTFFLLAFLLLAGGLVLFLFAHSHRQPSFQGRRLSYWVDQMPITFGILEEHSPPSMSIIHNDYVYVYRPQEQLRDCVRAVRAMGTNALPFLLARLQTRDSALKDKVRTWSYKFGIDPEKFDSPRFQRGKAATALQALKPLPESTLKQLRLLSTNTDAEIAFAARQVLTVKWEYSPFDQNIVEDENVQTNLVKK